MSNTPVNKIKKFGEFMETRKIWKSLDKLYIVGKVKLSIFKKPTDFQLHVYFTPVRKKILDVRINGVDINNPKLKIDFGISDNIQKARDWVERNGHEIDFETNRFE